MKKLSVVLGIVITLFSSFFVFASIGDLITGDKQGTGTGVLLGLLVFFLGTAFSGVFLARYGFSKQKSSLSEADLEQQVLALAKLAHGKLTVAEVALQCKLTIEESKAILDKMAAQGVAEMQFTDNGNFFYLFSSFLANLDANNPYKQTSTIPQEPEVEVRRDLNKPRALE